MAIEARQVTVRGKPMWSVDLPATKLGKRRRIFRATKRAAEAAAGEELEEHGIFGADLRAVTTSERVLILEFRDRLSLPEMRAAFVTAWEAKLHGSRLLKATIKEYLAAPREEPLSDSHMKNLRLRLGQFSDAFPERTIESLSSGEIEDYIRGKLASSPNHFRVLRAFFNHATRRRWLRANPFEHVEPPAITPAEKDILSPELMRKALRITAGWEPGCVRTRGNQPIAERFDPLLYRFIFGGLCGLREIEVERLDWKDVNLSAGKGGEIRVRKMKTQRRGIRERIFAIPPVARAWLLWAKPPKEGRVCMTAHRDFRTRRSRLVATLGLTEWPHNVLRRSFGSYHLAAYQIAATTAELMGHTDAKTTKAKYRVVRRKETALAWFALTPARVLNSEPQALPETQGLP